MSHKPNGSVPDNVGVVVIGRNEGDRLRRCLESVVHTAAKVVYIDSGSTDGSVMMARGKGVEVVELDMSIPFCAARARNVGHQRLVEVDSKLRFVQFVDGDCEINANWLAYAVESLQGRSDLAIVAGYLRERCPDASVYNRLGDLEWNFSGVGEVTEVGGIFMIKREAFESVGGFDPTVPAGEEPELCQRLSRQGWHFLRLDQSMALHDLAMTRFSQWWKRQIRTGYGGLDVANRFGLPGFKRITHRARFWSAWPLFVLVISSATGFIMGLVPGVIAALLAISIWPAQLCRIALRTWRNGQPFAVAAAYAFFSMISFWPQMIGQLLYWNNRLTKRPFRLLEHKSNCGSTSGRGK